MAEHRKLERGVWQTPYLVDDLPELVAVDSVGVVRKRLKVRPSVGIERATTRLNEYLDRVDPVDAADSPPLKLI